jgi:hypothetical protein
MMISRMMARRAVTAYGAFDYNLLFCGFLEAEFAEPSLDQWASSPSPDRMSAHEVANGPFVSGLPNWKRQKSDRNRRIA